MKFIWKTILSFVFITDAVSIYALYKPGDVIWGVKGGYSQTIGSYSDELNSSAYFGLYSIPFVRRYVLGEVDFTYSGYSLSNSDDSTLYRISMHAGPLLYYPLNKHIDIIGGASLGPTYFYVYRKESSQTSSTFKPSFSVKSGFIFHFPRGFGARLGIDYFQSWISNEQFTNINYYCAFVYNYHANMRYQSEFDDEAGIMAKIEKYYSLGEKDFANGELQKARISFSKVLKYNISHRGALSKIALIDSVENDYTLAMSYLRQKDYRRAIMLLEKVAQYKPEAQTDVNKIRKELSPQIKTLQKRGIFYYDKREYKHCIRIMKKILVIDPDNKVAKTYLPKAERRYKALKQLQ